MSLCWELRKVRLYGDKYQNSTIQVSDCAWGTSYMCVAGGRGELCLGGKTDTGVCVCHLSVCSSVCCSRSTVCSFSFGSTHSSGGRRP